MVQGVTKSVMEAYAALKGHQRARPQMLIPVDALEGPLRAGLMIMDALKDP